MIEAKVGELTPIIGTMTRAKQAWRRSEYLGTLTRGIAEPELTQSVVLAFLSSKGGVGKTTTAKLVAMAFADARRDRCVLIDANPDRGTLGTSFARGHTVYAQEPVVEKRVVPRERVHLGIDTVTAERQASEDIRTERIEIDGHDRRRRL